MDRNQFLGWAYTNRSICPQKYSKLLAMWPESESVKSGQEAWSLLNKADTESRSSPLNKLTELLLD